MIGKVLDGPAGSDDESGEGVLDEGCRRRGRRESSSGRSSGKLTFSATRDRSQGDEFDLAIRGRWVAEEALVGLVVETREVVGVLVFDLERRILAAEAEFGDMGLMGPM